MHWDLTQWVTPVHLFHEVCNPVGHYWISFYEKAKIVTMACGQNGSWNNYAHGKS